MQKVSLFIPCAIDAILVNVGEATVKLLSNLGFELDYHQEQTCCGQPAFTAGHTDIAIKAAKRFIEIFEDDEFIVSPSGSCVHTIRNSYCRVLKDEPSWYDRAVKMAQKVYELSEFLVDIAGIEDVNAEYHGTVAYHKSCHILRALGIDEQPEKLLAKVKNATLIPLNLAEECCGFGGQFSYKYPLISEVMAADKVNNFVASGADVLVVSDPGCLLNITGYVHRHRPDLKVRHLASFLADNMQGGVAV
ncbi:MAG: (Fe-S)-binding protein [Syntrophomonadaceae bacterium]|jgi:L-lactate dehydrogenase complex protein LldE